MKGEEKVFQKDLSARANGLILEGNDVRSYNSSHLFFASERSDGVPFLCKMRVKKEKKQRRI